MSFDDDLQAQLEHETPSLTVDASLNGKLYGVRVEQMDPLDWAALTDLHPARPDAQFDTIFGYNVRTLALDAAPLCAKLIVDGVATELDAPKWKQLFTALPGVTVTQIGDAMWNLNDYFPREAIGSLKKASAAQSARNSKQPTRSASPAAGSGGGSRKKSPTISTTPGDSSEQ